MSYINVNVTEVKVKNSRIVLREEYKRLLLEMRSEDERDDTPRTFAYVLWLLVTRKRATGLSRWAEPPVTCCRAIGCIAEVPPLRLHSR